MNLPHQPCKFFRTKRMYDAQRLPDKSVELDEALAFPFCWCNKTTTEIGPDDALAGLKLCCNPDRSCYRKP